MRSTRGVPSARNRNRLLLEHQRKRTDMNECPHFPFTRTDPLQPPSILARMREAGPIAKVTLYDGSEAWLVTRGKDVRAVLTDKRFSESPSTPGFPFFSEARKSFVGGDSLMP